MPFSATTSGVPPSRAIPSTIVPSGSGTEPPRSSIQRRTASPAPLRIERPSSSTPLMRVCALNGTSVAPASSRSRRPYRSFASTTIERPSGVSSARLESCAASARSPRVDAGQREERRRLPVAERDRPGLVEQQRRAVARRLDGAAGQREHVPLDEPVHARDPDRREQRADRRRDQADEQRDEHDHRLLRARVDGERLERDDREQEDDRQPGEQDVERDLVRRLLAARSLDQGDHPVEEALARLGRDRARRSGRRARACRR